MSKTESVTVHLDQASKARVDQLVGLLGGFRSVLLYELINEGAKARARRDPKFKAAMDALSTPSPATRQGE